MSTDTTSTAEERWLKRRMSGIGASEAAAVIGANPWCSAVELYGRKRGLIAPLEQTERMEWGHRLEPAIVAKFVEVTGRKVINDGKRKLWRHKEHGWMIATLDRRQEVTPAMLGHGETWPPFFDSMGWRSGILEVKNVSAYAKDDWTEGVPRHYWVQVQHQLAVTDYTYGSIAVLIGGQEFRWMDIRRDTTFINDILIPQERDFWNGVLSGEEPEVDATASAGQALATLHPGGENERISLPPEAGDWDERRETINSELKQLEQEKSLLTNRFKQAIGDADSGELPCGVQYKLTGKGRALRRAKVKP